MQQPPKAPAALLDYCKDVYRCVLLAMNLEAQAEEMRLPHRACITPRTIGVAVTCQATTELQYCNVYSIAIVRECLLPHRWPLDCYQIDCVHVIDTV